MNHLCPQQTQSLLLILLLWLLGVLACTTQAPAPNGSQPSPTPTPDFNFAVSVRDRNRNNQPIGAATVLLEVGNQTVAQEVTDDYGQANFKVPNVYLGKTARLYAKAYKYHSSDVVLVLRDDARQTIPLISENAPKLDPDPEEPAPPPGDPPRRARKPHEPRPDLEVFRVGETKTGPIADEQTVDYHFEAVRNVPLIFTASVAESRVAYKLEFYTAEGFFTGKELRVRSYDTEGRPFPFVPAETGSYILRIRGTESFGRYLVSMQEQ